MIKNKKNKICLNAFKKLFNKYKFTAELIGEV